MEVTLHAVKESSPRTCDLAIAQIPRLFDSIALCQIWPLYNPVILHSVNTKTIADDKEMIGTYTIV